VITAALVWGVLAPPAALRAQTPEPPGIELSLDDALTRALANSHRIEEARARGEAAEAVVGGRRAATRPQIAAVGGYTRTNHVDQFGIQMPNGQLRVIYPDIPDNYRARLDVQYPLYTSGRLQAIEQAARLEASATARDGDTTTVDVRLDVTRAFWNLVVARESQRSRPASCRRTMSSPCRRRKRGSGC
jgi:outer membrane protein TolC